MDSYFPANEQVSDDGIIPPVVSYDTASMLSFRNFKIMPGARLLLRDGKPFKIGGRAFDLLVLLLRARGTVVGKNEIFDKVWPTLSVDESNLRFQMGYLRRALGSDRDMIKTIQGRGYLFVAELDNESVHIGSSLEKPLQTSQAGYHENLSDCSPVIAVIDDDDDIREALNGLLRSSGLQVECYSSAQAFLAEMHSSAAECLILDVWMPGRSGLDLQSDLARGGLKLPIIFISGHADVHMSVRAMKAGAVEFLTKPVRHEDLLAAIQGAVSTARASEPLLRQG